MRRVALGLALLGAVFFCQNSANADVLNGTYNVATTGTGFVSEATSGTCSASGTVPAGLFNSTVVFENGNINNQLSLVYISIGNTTCPFYSYTSGKYTIADQGDGNFEAHGTLTTTGASPYAPCNRGGLQLVNTPFTIVGRADGAFTFSTSGAGAGSTYTEGTPAGGYSCVAPITNFVTSGTAIKVSGMP